MTAHIDCNSSTTILGSCPYSCVGNVFWSSDPQNLNAITCEERWNRTGLLCARCQKGFGPLVYSYDLSCIPCKATSITTVVKFAAIPFIFSHYSVLVLQYSESVLPSHLLTYLSLSVKYLLLHSTCKLLYQSNFIPNPVHDMCWKPFATFFGV